MSDSTHPAGRTRSRLSAVVVVLLVGGPLELTASVTMPLAFALFPVALTISSNACQRWTRSSSDPLFFPLPPTK